MLWTLLPLAAIMALIGVVLGFRDKSRVVAGLSMLVHVVTVALAWHLL